MFATQVRNPGSGSGKDHKEYRNWQINQKLFDGSGKWVEEMTAEEKASFKTSPEAMKLLVDFGYVSDDCW